MPGDPGVTVVTMLVCLFPFAHEAAGASSTRHSLRPLSTRGTVLQDPGAKAPRERDGVPHAVIASASEAIHGR